MVEQGIEKLAGFLPLHPHVLHGGRRPSLSRLPIRTCLVLGLGSCFLDLCLWVPLLTFNLSSYKYIYISFGLSHSCTAPIGVIYIYSLYCIRIHIHIYRCNICNMWLSMSQFLIYVLHLVENMGAHQVLTHKENPYQVLLVAQVCPVGGP